MNKKHIIMAGGKSERLYPLTVNIPKQFQRFIPNYDKSLLYYTYEIYKPIVNQTIILTTQEYNTLIHKEVGSNIPVLYEPEQYGTGYAISFVLSSSQIQPLDTLLITPSDHYYKDSKDLILKTINKAFDMIETDEYKDKLILIGQTLDKSFTQFGLIETNNKINNDNDDINILSLNRFIEKPHQFKFLRNMGIFIGKASTFIDLIKIDNELYNFIINLRFKNKKAQNLYKYIQNKKSFDRDVIEKIDKTRIITLGYNGEWLDIGLMENLISIGVINNDK